MIYFVSDIHLGLKFGNTPPHQREKIFCKFLDTIKPTATEIYLVGDIFDFWFEWKRTVPQGFTRTLGRLADMVDNGVKIQFFTGNHDLWMNGYLEKELGVTIHKNPLITQINGKTLYITHSDKLYDQKGISWIIDKMFRSQGGQKFARNFIHPDWLTKFGQGWSNSNRHKKKEVVAHQFQGEKDNWTKKSRKILEKNPEINYFIFGHLHIQLDYKLSPQTRMIVLGEWITDPAYATLDTNGEIQLHKFTDL